MVITEDQIIRHLDHGVLDERLRNQNDGIKLKAKSKSGSKLDSKIKLNKNEVISRLPGKFKEKDGYARQPKIDDKK